MVDRLLSARAGLLAVSAAALVPVHAGSLPLSAGATGESCAACHAGERTSGSVGAFVPGLSVNSGTTTPFARIDRPAPYVPLSVLLNSGSFGRNLTVDGFWRPTLRLRLGAQYTLINKPEALPDGSYDGARREAGTLFLYMHRAY